MERRGGALGGYAAVGYDPHARERMAERRISPTQVERAIAAPDKHYLSTNPPGRTVAEGTTASGKTLRVVYVERPGPAGVEAYVITAIRIGGRRE